LRSARRLRASLTGLRVFCLCSVLCVGVSLPGAFSEDTDKNLKDFNEDMLRLEKARRAAKA